MFSYLEDTSQLSFYSRLAGNNYKHHHKQEMLKPLFVLFQWDQYKSEPYLKLFQVKGIHLAHHQVRPLLPFLLDDFLLQLLSAYYLSNLPLIKDTPFSILPSLSFIPRISSLAVFACPSRSCIRCSLILFPFPLPNTFLLNLGRARIIRSPVNPALLIKSIKLNNSIIGGLFVYRGSP